MKKKSLWTALCFLLCVVNLGAAPPEPQGLRLLRADERSIVVEFTDRQGQLRVIEASGFEAVAIQHEMDHLDGLLFLDRVSSLKTDLYRRKKK